MSFEEALATGQLGEGLITGWWQSHGWNVLPAYEVEMHSGKGPRLYLSSRERLITPDLLIFRGDRVCWVEAKTKSAFTWHRLSGTWQTGIDRRHWQDYKVVGERTEFPLWMMFLHRPGGVAKDTPAGLESPSGLYTQELTRLRESVDHEHDGHGPSGMVYWQEAVLRRVCSYQDVVDATQVAA